MKYTGLLKERLVILENTGLLVKKNRSHFIMMLCFKILLLFTSAAAPFFFKMLVDDVMIGRSTSKLSIICTGLTVLYLIDTASVFGNRFYKNQFYRITKLELRCRVWKSLLKAPYSKIERSNPGELKNRVDTDVDSFDGFIQTQVIDYVYYSLTAVVIGIITLVLSWKLALFGFIMVPVSFWMTKRLGGGLRKTSEAYRSTWGKYESWLQGCLQSWKEIKSLNIIKSEAIIFTRFWHTLSRQFFVRQLFWYGNRSFISVKDFFITRMNLYFIGGLLIFSGEFTIGGLLVFMKYYEQFFSAIGSITEADMRLNDDIPSLVRVTEVLEARKKPECKAHKAAVETGSGKIDLKGVSFSYGSQESNVLEGINLQINKGDKLAIVGRSGCGKSTLIKLILGLYAVKEGSILLDGVDINGMNQDDLHKNIGVVMQDSMIFNLTIRENLLMAKPNADEEEILEAYCLACLDDFIKGLPHGLDTLVGEKGIKLSGGQRQRMAIARLMLSKPPVVIFDEATSSLDHQTEKAIHDSIEVLSKDRTIIMVAHRLSSIIKADRVAVMDNGRIVAEGCHNSLKGNNEIYDALFLKQYNLLEAYN